MQPIIDFPEDDVLQFANFLKSRLNLGHGYSVKAIRTENEAGKLQY